MIYDSFRTGLEVVCIPVEIEAAEMKKLLVFLLVVGLIGLAFFVGRLSKPNEDRRSRSDDRFHDTNHPDRSHDGSERRGRDDRESSHGLDRDNDAELGELYESYREAMFGRETTLFDKIDVFGSPKHAYDSVHQFLNRGWVVRAEDLGHSSVKSTAVWLFTEPDFRGLVSQYDVASPQIREGFSNDVSSVMVGNRIYADFHVDPQFGGERLRAYEDLSKLDRSFDDDIESLKLFVKADINSAWITGYRDGATRNLGLVFTMSTQDVDFFTPNSYRTGGCPVNGYNYPVKKLGDWVAENPMQMMITTSFFDKPGSNYHVIKCANPLGIAIASDGTHLPTDMYDNDYQLDGLFFTGSAWNHQVNIISGPQINEFVAQYKNSITEAVGGIIFIQHGSSVNGDVLGRLHKGNVRTARVAIGSSSYTSLVIAIVFPETDALPYMGMTASELASYLVNNYDVCQAIMLDGGGTATVWGQAPDETKPKIYPRKAKDRQGFRPVPNVLGIRGSVAELVPEGQ